MSRSAMILILACGLISSVSHPILGAPRPSAHHEHGSVDDTEHTPSDQHSKQRSKLNEIDRKVLLLITQREDERRALSDLKPQLKANRAELTQMQLEVDIQRHALIRAFTLKRRLRASKIAELLLSAHGPLELKRREINLNATLKAGAQQLISLSKSRRALLKAKRALQARETMTHEHQVRLSLQVDELLNLRAEEARLLYPDHTPPGSMTATQPRLAPPTLGVWKDTFQSYRGYRQAKLYGHGVQILGRQGAPIYAVEGGEVIFVGWLRNRGHTVIISHQKLMGLSNVKSIYMGVKPLVERGQKIKRQALIAELHNERDDGQLSFELRHRVRPIYPRQYVNEVPFDERDDD